MNEEVWKDVIGYEGLYQVSNLGNVKSLIRKRTKILAKTNTATGYYKVALYKNNTSKDFKIHRLVASAFLKNTDNKPNINHKDGNKKNNCSQNLEWCTQKENLAHAVQTGLKKVFSISISELEELYINRNLKPKEIANLYGVTKNVIRNRIIKYNLKKTRYDSKRIYAIQLDVLVLELKSGIKNSQLAKKYSCPVELINTRKYQFKKEGLL